MIDSSDIRHGKALIVGHLNANARNLEGRLESSTPARIGHVQLSTLTDLRVAGASPDN